jgi:hypothetical protein
MKSLKREARRFKARYGPRGHVSDNRPIRVIEDAGAARRIRKALDGRP